MGHAELLPIDSLAHLRFAQLRAETVTKLANQDRRGTRPEAEQGWGRNIAKQIEGLIYQHRRRPS